MRKALALAFVLATLFCLLACASAPVATWKVADARGIVGMTETQVIEKYGQPDSITRSTDKTIFEYRKAAEKGDSSNTLATLSTLGMVRGGSSPYIDVLEIQFKKGLAIDFACKENVKNQSSHLPFQ